VLLLEQYVGQTPPPLHVDDVDLGRLKLITRRRPANYHECPDIRARFNAPSIILAQRLANFINRTAVSLDDVVIDDATRAIGHLSVPSFQWLPGGTTVLTRRGNNPAVSFMPVTRECTTQRHLVLAVRTFNVAQPVHVRAGAAHLELVKPRGDPLTQVVIAHAPRLTLSSAAEFAVLLGVTRWLLDGRCALLDGWDNVDAAPA
jgi:hypothetical protein